MDQTGVFVKKEPPGNPGATEYEAAGLAWLAETGAPVVKVLGATGGSLELERLQTGSTTAEKARQFGVDLAQMHAAGAPGYGAAPGDYTGPAWMGRAPLEVIPATDFATRGEERSWGRFYSDLRIRPYASDVFGSVELQLIDRLCGVLDSGALDHPEPALVGEAGHLAARIHGDLWSGNVMWTEGGCVLIDPAAQGGHAEEDLAALDVFGMAHLDEIIAGYQSVSPLAPGWEDRVGLHQLHILIVHCYLFGRSYVPGFLSRVNTILKENNAL